MHDACIPGHTVRMRLPAARKLLENKDLRNQKPDKSNMCDNVTMLAQSMGRPVTTEFSSLNLQTQINQRVEQPQRTVALLACLRKAETLVELSHTVEALQLLSSYKPHQATAKSHHSLSTPALRLPSQIDSLGFGGCPQ